MPQRTVYVYSLSAAYRQKYCAAGRQASSSNSSAYAAEWRRTASLSPGNRRWTATAPRRPAEPHVAHWMPGRAAIRTGDAADGHCQPRLARHQRAHRHLQHDLLADSAMLRQGVCAHAQLALLGFIGIGDEAAVEPARTAGHVGEELGYVATGAGLGNGNLDVPIEQHSGHPHGQHGQFGVSGSAVRTPGHSAILQPHGRAFPGHGQCRRTVRPSQRPARHRCRQSPAARQTALPGPCR
jgi:hypothetical protein